MNWYALWVRSRHEKRVRLLLELRNIPSFLPLYTARHRWADRNKVLQLPLFPGYVFCNCHTHQRFTILGIPGVIDIVRCGSTFAVIEPSEIEALKRLVASCANAEPWPSLVIGKAVEIVAGPLAGLAGTVIAYKNELRLVLSVTLLRRSVLVEIDRASLRIESQAVEMPCLAAPTDIPRKESGLESTPMQYDVELAQ
jgi:transcription antitermination factor NusG